MNAILRQFASLYFRRVGHKHLKDYPQLACFSFDVISDYIFLDGQFERDELCALAELVFPALKANKICIDVGANIGNHSLFFSGHFKRVVSLEPNPRVFRLLKLNSELARNIEVFDLGLSDQTGIATAAFSQRNIGGASLQELPEAERRERLEHVQFALTTLDEFVAHSAYDQIDFIKIDAERHELKCFKGGKETLLRHEPVIAMEVLPDQVSSGRCSAVEFLRSIGYSHIYSMEVNNAGLWAPFNEGFLRQVKILLTNRRPPRQYHLQLIDKLKTQAYPMLICSTYSLQN